MQLSATRRGARLARLLATEQLRSWGLPFETAAQVVAELASNAALHGRVPGRDFRLALAVTDDTLRIEVTDTRGDRLPVAQRPGDDESGRGLILVDAFADRWGVIPGPAPRKTTWAEIDFAPCPGAIGTRCGTSALGRDERSRSRACLPEESACARMARSRSCRTISISV
ncbi:ATP-binding protein [Streptomyces sp. SLBN-118]|uniref:ATP-binding protein n=1 Tax=Streptomyces sp. SLBN-118 TaxID=2768454 RepID=UPI0021B4A5E3|nr:ATP-binding protein [Streptomyces sp. SLBN-118]